VLSCYYFSLAVVNLHFIYILFCNTCLYSPNSIHSLFYCSCTCRWSRHIVGIDRPTLLEYKFWILLIKLQNKSFQREANLLHEYQTEYIAFLLNILRPNSQIQISLSNVLSISIPNVISEGLGFYKLCQGEKTDLLHQTFHITASRHEIRWEFVSWINIILNSCHSDFSFPSFYHSLIPFYKTA